MHHTIAEPGSSRLHESAVLVQLLQKQFHAAGWEVPKGAASDQGAVADYLCAAPTSSVCLATLSC